MTLKLIPISSSVDVETGSRALKLLIRATSFSSLATSLAGAI